MEVYNKFHTLLSDIGYYLGRLPDAKLYEFNRIMEIYKKVDLYSAELDYLDRYYRFMIPQLERYLNQIKSELNLAA